MAQYRKTRVKKKNNTKKSSAVDFSTSSNPKIMNYTCYCRTLNTKPQHIFVLDLDNLRVDTHTSTTT